MTVFRPADVAILQESSSFGLSFALIVVFYKTASIVLISGSSFAFIDVVTVHCGWLKASFTILYCMISARLSR